MFRSSIVVALVLAFSSPSFSQSSSSDSSAKKAETPPAQSIPQKGKKKGSNPLVPMILSTCVPGLGQIYNGKYWKTPIVYAAMGTTFYFFSYNNKYYKEYKQAYLNKTDTSTTTIDLYEDYSPEQLKELESYHRKYRDLNVILTALCYTLNVVDAYVDGHLKNFDVSDDLSLHISPSLHLPSHALRPKPVAGITLALTF